MTNVNNLPPIVPGVAPTPSAPPTAPRGRWLRRYWWVAIVATMGVIASTVFAVSLLIHVPYVIIAPGNTEPVNDLISVPSDHHFPTKDRVDLVTVTLDDSVTLFEKVRAEHSSDEELQPAKQVLGDQTPQENDQLNQVLMRQSKDSAVVAALAKLGYKVQPTQTGALVESIEHDAPANGVIAVGDTIVAVDGQPIKSRDDLIAALKTRKPGDRTTFTVESSTGQRRDVDVVLVPRKDDPTVGFLGVGASDRLSFPDLPFDVTIDSQRIGGPSAGLAFTLGLLDLMTPGDLTGGHEVAATGTISGDGTVGPIGGIEQKVITVQRAHIGYFLVPSDDAPGARAQAAGSGLQIIEVHNLDDALAFLASIGGSGLPPPVTG